MSQGDNHSTTQSTLGILEEVVSKCPPFKKKKKRRDTLVFVGTSLCLFEERLPPYRWQPYEFKTLKLSVNSGD
jgi:hypothetical protein